MTKTEITSALLGATSNRIGTPVPAINKVQCYLQDLGLVGPDGGLTRQGSIQRERAMNAALDDAFGA